MNKIWKFLIYGYLVLSVIFIIEAVLNWNTDRQKSYLLIVFAITTVILFFFKQKFRKKIRNRNQHK